MTDEKQPAKHNPPIVPCWMTKREYFAVLALQGLLGNADVFALPDAVGVEGTDNIADVTEIAVGIADALIAQLEK